MNPCYPQKLITEESSIEEEFFKIGKLLGDKKILVLEIFNLLPEEIKRATVLRDHLAKRMLYEFGKPLTTSSSSYHCFGGNQNLEIKNLYLAIRAAKSRLNPSDAEKFIRSISDPNNHQDFLFEMRPVIYLKKGLNPKYESESNCAQNKNVDWEVGGGEYTILLEVKNRIGSTAEHLEYIDKMLSELSSGVDPENIAPPEAPNSEKLFKSIEYKFNNQENTNVLQGAWINTGMKEDKKSLHSCFKALDKRKIQFAIIAGWGKRAYILSVNEACKKTILEYFDLIESSDLISFDGAKT